MTEQTAPAEFVDPHPQLGKLEFGSTRVISGAAWAKWAGFGCGCMGLITLLGGGGFAVLSAVSAFANPNMSVSAGMTVAVVFGLGALISAAVSGGAAYMGIRHAKNSPDTVQRVGVYASGVDYEIGEQSGVLPWAEITNFTTSPAYTRAKGIKINLNLVWFIIRHGDALLNMDKVPELRQMREFVTAQLIATHVPRHVEAVSSGETVAFGSIKVGPDGITTGGLVSATTSWESLRGLDIGNRGDIVARDGLLGNAGSPYAETPNAVVLFALVEALLERRASGS